MPRWRLNIMKNESFLFRRITYFLMAVFGAGIFAVLTYYSFFYTQYMLPREMEKAIDKKDVVWLNCVAFIAFFLIAFIIRYMERRFSDRMKRIAEGLVLCVSALWILGAGLYWICSLDRIPEGDQAFIYGGASYFMEGQYSFFSHGGYCQIYPGQLGQIALVEMLFRVIGPYRYFAVQVISVMMAVGIHLLGYYILRELEQGFTYRVIYCFLMMGNLPLICYTSWVYGDLPSVFFLEAAVFAVLRFHRDLKIRYGLFAVICFVLAVLTRQNSWIFLVAFLILGTIYAISFKRIRMLTLCVLFLGSTLLSSFAIRTTYEIRSGYRIGSGLPINSWIMMGMQDSRFGSGWYNNYPKEVAEEADWDFKEVERQMQEGIRLRLEEFRKKPADAFRFYKNKILSQWNEPLCQSVFFSAKYMGEDVPKPGSLCFALYYTQEGFFQLLSVADRWHFLICLGTFLYFVTAVRSKRQPMEYLSAVTVLGGFLFSILWEAKARYVFPYYMMMYPMAVMGYGKSAVMFRSFVRRIRDKVSTKRLLEQKRGITETEPGSMPENVQKTVSDQ